MTDWKAIARALGIDSGAAELARTVAPLEALESVFDPLAAKVTPDLEPAVIFDPTPGGEPTRA